MEIYFPNKIFSPAGELPGNCMYKVIDCQSIVARKLFFLNYSLAHFSRRLLLTTDTELSAIAAPAIIGFSRKPLIG